MKRGPFLLLLLCLLLSLCACSRGRDQQKEYKIYYIAAELENVQGEDAIQGSSIKIPQEENTDLRRQLAEAKIEREQLDQLEELANVLNFDYTKKKFKLVSADVTSLDGSNWTNVFTINIGSESGVEVGDAVVNGMGLIGKIQDTGKGWSKVVSIIDDDSKVSFKLARDTKQLGVVEGNSLGEISGYMLDSESLVSQGDIIITSGLGTYPEGLEIGNVKDVAYNSNTLLKEITVEPAVNFKNLEKVSVIL